MSKTFKKDWQYYKFCLYGFLKNQRFFDPFLILFFQEKGLNYTQIGTLYSIRFIIRAILEIPSGMVADALGRRGTMLFSYGMYLISFPSYYLSNNFVWLLVPTIIFAIGDAFRTGTHKAMIFEYLKRKGWSDLKTDYYGHTRSWSQAGSALSSLLAAAVIVFSGNYSTVFLLSIIPYIIGFILLASYPKYLNGVENSSGSINKKRIIKVFRSTIKAVRSKKRISSLFNVSTYSGYFMALKDYIQPMLHTFTVSLPFFITLSEKKRTAIIIGLTYFVLYFLTASASRSAGKIKNWIGSVPRTVSILMIVGFSVGMIAAIGEFAHLTILAISMFLLIQIIENMRRPATVAYISEQFNDKIMASVLSVESQLHSVIAAILAFLTGVIFQYFSLAMALAIVTGVSFGISILFISLHKK